MNPKHVAQRWTTIAYSGECGKVSNALWNEIWSGESRKSFLIRTHNDKKIRFLNHGKGVAKWVSNGFEWPDWGTSFRPPGKNPDATYTIYYDKDSSGEFENFVTYGQDQENGPCIPVTSDVWIYDKNFNYLERHLDTKTTGRGCYAFTARGLKPRLRFLGSYNNDEFTQSEAKNFSPDSISIGVRYGPHVIEQL